MKIPETSREVEAWLKSHTVEDLEAAMWEMKGRSAEMVAEILSLVYEISDDIVGVEIPQIKALA